MYRVEIYAESRTKKSGWERCNRLNWLYDNEYTEDDDPFVAEPLPETPEECDAFWEPMYYLYRSRYSDAELEAMASNRTEYRLKADFYKLDDDDVYDQYGELEASVWRLESQIAAELLGIADDD